MSDAFFIFQLLAIPLAPMGLVVFCAANLPKEPRLRAVALLMYMIALLGLYVGVAYLAMLSWNNQDPYWVKAWAPLLWNIQMGGTLALFFAIFMIPTLAGLVIWRLVALLIVLAKWKTKTPGYR